MYLASIYGRVRRRHRMDRIGRQELRFFGGGHTFHVKFRAIQACRRHRIQNAHTTVAWLHNRTKNGVWWGRRCTAECAGGVSFLSCFVQTTSRPKLQRPLVLSNFFYSHYASFHFIIVIAPHSHLSLHYQARNRGETKKDVRYRRIGQPFVLAPKIAPTWF